MQVELSKIAKQTLREEIEFLETTWSNKEIVAFLHDIKRVSAVLKEGHFKRYPIYSRDIRSALIGKKHVRMFFRMENPHTIIVLLFFDMRQDPQKIIDLLA